MFFKNGQGMPINVIVIAVLALIVLVVIGFIFSDSAGKFVKNANSCVSKNGHCMSPALKCASNKTIILTSDCKYVGKTNDDEKDGQCCISVFG